MKKVKYVGQIDGVIVMLPQAPVVVNFGDVIDVPDDFINANFEDYVAPTVDTSKSTSSK
jgi:hypothetical protein